MKKANPVLALVAGIVLLFIPLEFIKFVLAVYLIVIGIVGLMEKKA